MAEGQVSGPGKYSKRTDAGQTPKDIPNAAYGEQKEFQNIQGSAKMAQSNQEKPMGMPGGMPKVTPLTDPTQRPDEPVTQGSPSGPGAGPASIGMGMNMKDQNKADATQLAEFLPSLQRMANRPETPASFVRFVKYIRENSQ